MADLTISRFDSDDVVVLYPAGPIALGDTSAQLHKYLRELVKEGKSKILVSLEDVTALDSSGLGTLVAGYTTLEKNGGQMKLTNLTKRIAELMTITKLYTVFEIFDDEIVAIDSFKKTGEPATVETAT